MALTLTFNRSLCSKSIKLIVLRVNFLKWEFNLLSGISDFLKKRAWKRIVHLLWHYVPAVAISLYLSVVVVFHVWCSSVSPDLFWNSAEIWLFSSGPEQARLCRWKSTNGSSFIDLLLRSVSAMLNIRTAITFQSLVTQRLFSPHQWIFCNIMSGLHAGNKEKEISYRNPKPPELSVFRRREGNTKISLFLQPQRSSDQVEKCCYTLLLLL